MAGQRLHCYDCKQRYCSASCQRQVSAALHHCQGMHACLSSRPCTCMPEKWRPVAQDWPAHKAVCKAAQRLG
jgi:hypothetical protein